MGQIDVASYKNIYLQTAKEYLDKMSISLSTLANNVSDKEALNNLHIASHSLRSQSQVMGFENMANLSETIEKRANDILSGTAIIDNNFINLSKDSIEKLYLEFSKVEKGDTA